MIKISFYTVLALLAFAANSVLCRLALASDAIDAFSFTSIRLLSGIVVLVVLSKIIHPTEVATVKGGWRASILLFTYALTFSFAYITLETGTGALILFATVQIVMIMAGLLSGDKLHRIEWLGLVVAFAGFVYLVMPGLATPSLLGFILMSISGIAWSFYTILGKGSINPLLDTTYYFIRTLPFVIILMLITIPYAAVSPTGILLAVLSGGIASGIGYTIWYLALGGLSTTQAAVVQVLVPVIAALGGVLFAHESFSGRLVFSLMIILGGVLMVVLGKRYFSLSLSRKT